MSLFDTNVGPDMSIVIEHDASTEVALPSHTALFEAFPPRPLPLQPSSLTRNTAISQWFTNENSSTTSDLILANAFTEAKTIFNTELTRDECKKIWLKDHTSMTDVITAITDVRTKYDKKPASKARKWLAVLSGRVMYYSTVLDVLVQQYPEYVSLAWGAMKFLFIAVNNHEQKITQLAESFARIAEILPRTELTLILYPTDLMREAVAVLYARVLKFITQSVKWFKQGKLSHTLGAIVKPWALSFKENFENIASQSKYIDELSNTASKAELRATHLDLLDTHSEIRDMRIEIRGLAEYFHQRTDFLVRDSLVKEMTRAQVLPTLLTETPASSNMPQLSHLLTLISFEHQPESRSSLIYCQSLERKNRAQTILPPSQIAILQRWATLPSSSLLLLDSSVKNLSKGAMVDLLNLLNTTGEPVIWALRFPDYWELQLGTSSILRMLLTQVLELNLTAPSISAELLAGARTDREWVQLLDHALDGISRVFVAIDAGLLASATGNSRYNATRWLQILMRSITSSSLKIFISASIMDENYMSRTWQTDMWMKVSAVGNQKGNRGRNVSRPGRHRLSNLGTTWIDE